MAKGSKTRRAVLYLCITALVSAGILGLVYLFAGLFPACAAGGSLYLFFVLILVIRRSLQAAYRRENSVKDQDSFRTLMTTTPDYVALVDKLNCVTYISKPLADLAHIEAVDMVIGRPILDLFPNMDMKLMISTIVKAGGSYEDTWQLNLDGDERYFKIIADRLLGSTGGLLINMSDITPVMEAKNETEKAAQALKVERDEIAAMKDNLNEGIFLMDGDCRIQPQYSQALEDILAGKEFQGKSFLDLLTKSFKAKDLPIVKNYFSMILNQSYDKAMLDDINPLQELAYLSEAGITKTLRCSFSRVDRGGGLIFVMGSIQDITVEKELQRQIAEEEARRQEEMSSLFELVQVEPGVFGDYLEDSDYEFGRINEILKDSNLSSHDALVEIYQAVHAIKSNSVILGLNTVGRKYHELEDTIRELRDRDEVGFDDILHVASELERVMQEKDKFQETLGKIRSFQSGSASKKQGDDILIETLSRAVDKAAKDLQKKARFVPEGIDPLAMERGPRRLMKEVLLQLVRNGVYHGIESPEERRAAGKAETGLVGLSIKVEGERIHMSLRDDGRGLDFEKIRQKAEALNMIRSPEEGRDKNQLLKFLFAPGFSTAEEADMHAGRGIGLNLVKERIQEKRGTIKLQTENGKGTVFNIFIPLEAEEAESRAS